MRCINVHSQDVYREDDIEEFRDLQRELEQTAKNCRVLQFKLRKIEREKEQAESDRRHLEEKLKDMGTSTAEAQATSAEYFDNRRCRELESELRIAKEVQHTCV